MIIWFHLISRTITFGKKLYCNSTQKDVIHCMCESLYILPFQEKFPENKHCVFWEKRVWLAYRQTKNRFVGFQNVKKAKQSLFERYIQDR